MKLILTKPLLIILFLLVGSRAFSQPTIGTTTFDGPGTVTIASQAPAPRSGTLLGWSIYINGSGNGLIQNYGSRTPSDLYISLSGATTVNIGSDDGSEFALGNLVIDFYEYTAEYTITGYRNGVATGSTKRTGSSGFHTIDLSGNSDFNNIDQFRFTGFGGRNISLAIDEITISAAIPNTPPTASNVTIANGPYEGLSYAFSTSDFNFSDADGDKMYDVIFHTLPGAGVIYLDENLNGIIDAGEQISSGEIKFDSTQLNAGQLKYLQNGSTNTSFQFSVGDGEDYSPTYTATLNVVPIPTVTLSLGTASRQESTTTATPVTATLSNAYGAPVTVYLDFSGTATDGGVDYSISADSILIAPGNTSNSINIANVPDALYEGNETVIIDISSVNNGTENGTQQVTYTIIDDDPQPSASLLLRDIYNPIEDESGGHAYIVGSINTPAGVPVTIPLSFSGTASGGGTDYSITGTNIVISAGQTMDSIRITSQYDGIEEGDETIIIDMLMPTNATRNGTQKVTLTIKDEDAVPPTGYSVSIDQSAINASNESEASFTFASAEIGTTYNYSFTSSGGAGSITGSGTISTATDKITNIDLSGLPEGNITLSVTLTNSFGATGNATTDTITKDTIVPSGYTVSIDQNAINADNEDNISFTFANAEAGATYNYTFSSTGGGTNVIGSGTINSATDKVTGIDLSSLGEGTISLSVTLTDTNSNSGVAATSSTQKDVVAPTGYAVSLELSGEPAINLSNEDLIEFQASGLETGTTLTYSFTSSGGGTAVSGTETVTSATQQFDNGGAGYDLSGLADGTITLTINLKDATGNVGSNVTDTETKDATAPSGYSVSWADNLINNAEADSTTFAISNAEIGTTLHYTITSAGDGNTATVSNTISIDSVNQSILVDVSSLVDGVLTLTMNLEDLNGNTGASLTDNTTLDTTPPSGYTVSIDQSVINSYNYDSASFTFSGAEIDATYSYTYSSTGTGTNATGSGTITSATQQISNIDLTTVGDGTVTLTVTLTDVAGNIGIADTSSVNKDTVPPIFISVDDNGGDNEYTSGDSVTIIADLDETGLTVTADLSAINTGFSSSSSLTDNGDGTYSITIADVDANDNMVENSNIAITITATDDAGNISTNNNLVFNLDKTAPTGYSINIDQAEINDTNDDALSFTFSNAEVDAHYNYSISSSGGGSNLTGSGTISTSTDKVADIDISNLPDGVITVSVTLTDTFGNTGNAVNDTVNKETALISFNTTASQGAESVSTANIPVSITIASAYDISVDYTVSGTATNGEDYTLNDGKLIITAGNTTGNIEITNIINNELVEGNKSIIITLSNPVNAALGTNVQHTYTILDDDQKAPQTITFEPISDRRVGDNPVVLNAVGGNSGEPVTFSISTSPSTGVASLSNGVITIIGAGTITVTASQAGNAFFEPAQDVSQSFRILEGELFLPTLFSPNNDGTNDRFIVRGGADINQIEFSIYDRNGNEVYNTSSLSELTQSGWDGTNDGTEQPQGAYVWVVKGSYSNGAPITINGKDSGIIRLAR